MGWSGTLMKLKKDTLYKIRFIDHAIGDDSVVCEACGWFQYESKSTATFTWWKIDSKCKETVLANLELFSLVKSAFVTCVEI